MLIKEQQFQRRVRITACRNANGAIKQIRVSDRLAAVLCLANSLLGAAYQPFPPSALPKRTILYVHVCIHQSKSEKKINKKIKNGKYADLNVKMSIPQASTWSNCYSLFPYKAQPLSNLVTHKVGPNKPLENKFISSVAPHKAVESMKTTFLGF